MSPKLKACSRSPREGIRITDNQGGNHDGSLHGKRGLVVGVATEASIATGCARAFAGVGATLAATYLSDKALPHVRAVTDPLGCTLLVPCDVRVPG